MPTEHSRGTSSYRAPELLGNISTFSSKVDIWGLGCILFELLVKRKAFENDWAVREYAARNDTLRVPLEYFASEIHCPVTNLIHKMLNINPKQRPKSNELCEVFTWLLSPAVIPRESGNEFFSEIYRPLSASKASYQLQDISYLL